MIASADASLKEPARALGKEANELHLIFAKIWRSRNEGK
jgi:hypothetical protein